jgi:small subunit ribosomal protein S17
MSESTATKRKNTKEGHVVSTKMDKTIVVEVTRRVSHPLYRRVVTRKKKFHVHDGENTCLPGDFVRISECRPLSRTKRWKLDEVIRRAVQVGDAE